MRVPTNKDGCELRAPDNIIVDPGPEKKKNG